MIDIDEEMQIVEGARLSDTKAPEQLDTERARTFVSKVMCNDESLMKRTHTAFSSRKLLFWSSVVVSAAAVFALVLWLADISHRPETDGKGTPALLQENPVIHATAASIDSLASETDSIELAVREIMK